MQKYKIYRTLRSVDLQNERLARPARARPARLHSPKMPKRGPATPVAGPRSVSLSKLATGRRQLTGCRSHCCRRCVSSSCGGRARWAPRHPCPAWARGAAALAGQTSRCGRRHRGRADSRGARGAPRGVARGGGHARRGCGRSGAACAAARRRGQHGLSCRGRSGAACAATRRRGRHGLSYHGRSGAACRRHARHGPSCRGRSDGEACRHRHATRHRRRRRRSP